MHRENSFTLGKFALIGVIMAVLTVALISVDTSTAATIETVTYSFGNSVLDGREPDAGLVFDTAGNLYGTTGSGGAHLWGTVFELIPSSSSWAENVLYNFALSSGGAAPSNVILDAAGNLYGTTALGGNSGCSGGCGVVFKLARSATGWTESVLYTFTGGLDGAQPGAGLVFDKAGNLYGTTRYGGRGKCNFGIPGCGTVFQLRPNANGTWTETVIYNFKGGLDGDTPAASLVIDNSGHNPARLFGTTAGNGPTDPGTIFRIVKSPTGWAYKRLYNFTGGADGNSPEAPLIVDGSGNLYGTTRYGGTGTCSIYGYNGCGTVFELVRGTVWTEKVLHSFVGGSSDGAYPAAAVVFDASGHLFGTTAGGGLTGWSGTFGCGTVFELTNAGTGTWNINLVHEFDNSTSTDGASPLGTVVFDSAGILYGTTQLGGSFNSGTAFEIAP